MANQLEALLNRVLTEDLVDNGYEFTVRKTDGTADTPARHIVALNAKNAHQAEGLAAMLNELAGAEIFTAGAAGTVFAHVQRAAQPFQYTLGAAIEERMAEAIDQQNWALYENPAAINTVSSIRDLLSNRETSHKKTGGREDR